MPCFTSPRVVSYSPPKSGRKMKISTLRAHNMWAFSLLFDPQVVYGFELCQNIYISTFHVYFPRSLPWCRRLIKHFGRWPTSTTHGRRRRSGRWQRLSIQSRWSAANISSKKHTFIIGLVVRHKRTVANTFAMERNETRATYLGRAQKVSIWRRSSGKFLPQIKITCSGGTLKKMASRKFKPCRVLIQSITRLHHSGLDYKIKPWIFGVSKPSERTACVGELFFS